MGEEIGAPAPGDTESSTRRFFDSAFDEPIYDGAHRRYYLLCCAPRSGSWLLCDLLRRSGALGVPAEYFQPGRDAKVLAQRFGLERQGTIDVHRYAAAVKRHRTTANGVFGAKVQYWHMPALMKERVVSRHFPAAKFVHLSRNDVVAQGVSLAIAEQTEQYVRFRDDAGEVQCPPQSSFDEARVMKAIDYVLRDELKWKKFFAMNGLQPLRLTYEALLEDPQRTCQQLARYVGVDTDHAFSLADTDLLRQSNELNEEWIKRIKALAAY